MKISIDTVIFDLDGVIIDSAADIIAATNHTRGFFNFPPLPGPKIISYIGDGLGTLLRRSFEGSSEELVAQALSLYREYYWDHALENTDLFPNVKNILTILNRELNKKVAVVTNKTEKATEHILTGLGIRDYFDLLIGPESVQLLKPDPEGILLVLAKTETNPQRAIMVGDTHTDIEAGKKAGTWTCGASYGFGDKDRLIQAGADFYIADIFELLQYIE